MKALSTIACLLLVSVLSILAVPAASNASSEDDEMLRATIIGPELPRDGKRVAHLLDEGANPNVRDQFGRTAVHYAAGEQTGIGGTGAILNLLLARGGDCCYKDRQGDTPFHLAVAEGIKGLADYADIQNRIQRLLEHGADPDETNRRGYTPLHFSAKSRSRNHGAALVNNLLQAAADPDRAADDGNTPLHLAAGASTILDRGHGHDLFSQSDLTSNSIAAFADDAFIIRALLAADANPNAANAAGMTPLLIALNLAQEPRSHIVAATNALLSADADPNATTPDDMTPLHIVLDYPESRSDRAHRMTEEGIALVEALLGAGADANVKNPQGDTPLHVVVRHERGKEMVEALLAGGADPCIRNNEERWLPEQLARGLGQSSVELALQLAGGSEDECGKREEEKLGLDRNARRRLQSCLKTQGFDPGTPDGLFGSRTRSAIAGWQEAQGGEGEASGYLTQDELDALLVSCERAGPTPLCTGETDTPCWMETANQPGCHVWNPRPAPEETVTWSGACVDGKASGKGKSVWRFRRDGAWKTSGGEGELREGKSRYGHWVTFSSRGDVWEGPYVDGKHGRWVKRGTRGDVWQCWYRGERVDTGHSLCVTAAPDTKMQATKGNALRSGPSDDYEQLGWLSAGDKVTVTREASRWAWVETESGDQGFVPLSVLEEVAGFAVGDVFQDCPECPEMVVVPAGEVLIGKRSEHRVSISVPFAVGKYQVTRGEFTRFVSATGHQTGRCYLLLFEFMEQEYSEGFPQDDRHPVVCVSWLDAQAYVDWLSEKTGNQYRLLSEAEWEHAARAGSTTSYPWEDEASRHCDHANGYDQTANSWFDHESVYSSYQTDTLLCRDGFVFTAPVGSYRENDFGLFDMIGNASEWVEDCYQDNFIGAPSDGSARVSCTYGDYYSPIIRGHAWLDLPEGLVVWARGGGSEDTATNTIGFRVALTLAQ